MWFFPFEKYSGHNGCLVRFIVLGHVNGRRRDEKDYNSPLKKKKNISYRRWYYKSHTPTLKEPRTIRNDRPIWFMVAFTPQKKKKINNKKDKDISLCLFILFAETPFLRLVARRTVFTNLTQPRRACFLRPRVIVLVSKGSWLTNKQNPDVSL